MPRNVAGMSERVKVPALGTPQIEGHKRRGKKCREHRTRCSEQPSGFKMRIGLQNRLRDRGPHFLVEFSGHDLIRQQADRT